MSSHPTLAACPNCGAPLPGKLATSTAICVFCNASFTLGAPAQPGAAPVVTVQAIPPEDIERIKQLLIDAKREGAVEIYRKAAGVKPLEAEMAIDNMVLGSYGELTRHLPIGALGFVMYGLLVGGPAALAAWAGHAALTDPDTTYRIPLVLVAVVAIALAVRTFISFLVHLRATITHRFGATGRGRVVRQGVLRAMPEKDAYLVAVVFEVSPDDGSAVFVDQETLFVSGATMAKLAPNNVLAVRFDGARKHVIVKAPATVL